jgi:hypothetical protein
MIHVSFLCSSQNKPTASYTSGFGSTWFHKPLLHVGLIILMLEAYTKSFHHYACLRLIKQRIKTKLVIKKAHKQK